jgi:LPS-assembly lipoprotein
MIMNSSSRWIVVLGLFFGLTACGFQPLYGTRHDGGSAGHDLAFVAVAEQTTRLGQLIRNELIPSMAAPGRDDDLYTLELLPRAAEEVSIQAFDTDVLRRSFRVDVDFRLIENSSGTNLYAGRTFSQASYDRTGTPFANAQARITAEERAAKEVGVDIRTRIAAFFASR